MDFYDKVYVDVIFTMYAGGRIVPLRLKIGDIVYKVEKVIDIINDEKTDTIQYTCKVRGRRRYLYFQRIKLKWYIERRSHF